jgi:Ni,Fe-hydrogenase I cytochrome b subunit
MSEKPRRWFQIHLSTAIVLMLVASILLGLNFHSTIPADAEISRFKWTVEGFPWTCTDAFSILPKPFFLDVAFAAFVLAGIVMVSEYAIRRRQSRTDKNP